MSSPNQHFRLQIEYNQILEIIFFLSNRDDGDDPNDLFLQLGLQTYIIMSTWHKVVGQKIKCSIWQQRNNWTSYSPLKAKESRTLNETKQTTNHRHFHKSLFIASPMRARRAVPWVVPGRARSSPLF